MDDYLCWWIIGSESDVTRYALINTGSSKDAY